MAQSRFEKQFARLCAIYGGHIRYFRILLYIVYLVRGRL